MLNLDIFNPWWRERRVPQFLLGKRRRVLGDILQNIDVRQMLILSGLRRAGKTTLMFQVIDELLKTHGVSPFEILYFTFDAVQAELMDVIAEYERDVLRGKIRDAGRIYLFLDEIQKLDDWPNKVKVIYDLNPNVKLLLSGSAAITLIKGTRESLAGRFFDYRIEPLDFDEFISFRGIRVDRDREGLFELDLRNAFGEYLATGGFIETFDFNELQRRRYFRESLLERVIFKDLPAEFSVRSPDLLLRLVIVIADKPGMYLEYSNLGNDLGFDQRTIADYISYLEHALLVSKLYNYSPNRLTSEKKMRRAYLASTAFTKALTAQPDRSLFLEQFFINAFKARFFWRSPQRDEVDIVLAEDGVVPVEVKIRSKVSAGDAKPLFKFMKRYDVDRGYIISEATEAVFSDDGRTVEVIPYWRYWTLKAKLGMS
ncbi:MAG: ATP-binding protein [Actinobacteria bacterium]|nr:ATP-binding protein [Actinomycetota bacterium]